MPLIGSVKEQDTPGSSKDLGLTGSIIIAEEPDASFPSMPGSDTKFFVSGTVEKRTTVDASTAVFGGDLAVSGVLYGTNQVWADYGVVDTLKLVTGPYAGLEFIGGKAGFTGRINDDAGITPPQVLASDHFFFVSGTIQSEFAAYPARSVFGGDLVTSGNVHLALNNTNDADLDSVGSDVNVFVSGSGYSKGQEYANGVALFGGDVVISGSLSAKQKHIATHKYTKSSADLQYIRFNAAGSDGSPGVNNKFIAPYAGQLVKVIARSTTAMDSTVISSHQGSDGDTNLQTDAIESITVDVASANTAYEFTFSDSYFSQGWILGLSVNPTTGPGNLDLVSVWEFDTYK